MTPTATNAASTVPRSRMSAANAQVTQRDEERPADGARGYGEWRERRVRRGHPGCPEQDETNGQTDGRGKRRRGAESRPYLCGRERVHVSSPPPTWPWPLPRMPGGTVLLAGPSSRLAVG